MRSEREIAGNALRERRVDVAKRTDGEKEMVRKGRLASIREDGKHAREKARIAKERKKRRRPDQGEE